MHDLDTGTSLGDLSMLGHHITETTERPLGQGLLTLVSATIRLNEALEGHDDEIVSEELKLAAKRYREVADALEREAEL